MWEVLVWLSTWPGYLEQPCKVYKETKTVGIVMTNCLLGARLIQRSWPLLLTDPP